jgi:hypothetical protein
VLRGAVSLGALTFLTGCDVSEYDQVQTALRAVSSWNDKVQSLISGPFSEAQFVKTAALQCPLRFVASVPYIVGTLGLIAWGYVAHGSFNEQRLDMRWHGLSQTLSVPPSDLGRCRFVPTQRPFLRSTTTA